MPRHRIGCAPLANRIGKAADILLSSSLTPEPVAWEVRCGLHWHIQSQSYKGSYIVPGHSSSCPYQDSRALHAYAGTLRVRFCKHAIAVASYMKILRNHFNADVRRREIDLGILPDGTFNAYASRLGICHIRALGREPIGRDGATYGFADAASRVRYSLWQWNGQLRTVPRPWGSRRWLRSPYWRQQYRCHICNTWLTPPGDTTMDKIEPVRKWKQDFAALSPEETMEHATFVLGIGALIAPMLPRRGVMPSLPRSEIASLVS